MSFDPHQNIFYFYRGPKSKKEHRGVDFQLENNTTKALINTLYFSKPNVCKDFILHFLSINIGDSPIKYALQKQTIGTQKIQQKKNRILLGICPQLLYSEEDLNNSRDENISELDAQDSIPDAWIWDKDNVILIESKTRMKFDRDQLKRHEDILSYPTDKIIIFWEEIHSHFKNKIENDINSKDNEKENFLIKQFVEYLELINLSKFSGWKKEDFEFFFYFEEDEKRRLKNKMEKFVSEVLDNQDVSDIIDSYKHGRVSKDSNSIWCELDMKDERFKLSDKEYFLNYTLELVSSHFQVSIVFPLFPSIKKLKKILNEKESDIIYQFETIFGKEINQNHNHSKLMELIKDVDYNANTIPNYKIRVFDHYFINIGNRHWIPKAEITIDNQTLNKHEWFEFLKHYISLYHPKDSERDSHWGAGLHILKQYPRGSEILESPDNLIKDVQDTLLNFYKFVQTFVN